MIWLYWGQAHGGETPDCAGHITRVEVAKDPGIQRIRNFLHPTKIDWQETQLPDDLNSRWPEFDGTVLYRITWQRDCEQPVAIALDYLYLSSLAYVENNIGHPLFPIDASHWAPTIGDVARPLYARIPDEEIHLGVNHITVMAARHGDQFKAGMGRAYIGAPQEVYRHYRWRLFTRVWLPFIVLDTGAALAIVFVLLWLARSREKAFLWFSLTALLFFGYYTLGERPLDSLPLFSPQVWERLRASLLILFGGCSLIFVLRLLSWRALLGVIGLGCLVLAELLVVWLAPAAWLPNAARLVSLSLIGSLLVGVALFGVAAITRQEERQPMGLYTILIVMGVLVYNQSSLKYSSWITALSVALVLVLAQFFLRGIRRMQRFNLELKKSVQEARAELRETLTREHALEVENARLGGRLVLARDLHDGVGNHLVSAITRIERDRTDSNPARTLSLLKWLREDLRQLIDTNSAHAESVPETPKAWLAPQRRRSGPMLEDVGIRATWQVPEVWPWTPSSAQSIALLRILQEACNNVIKHSHATELRVVLDVTDTQALRLTIEDNGIGFDVDQARGGTGSVGMSSMAERARQMGATLEMQSTPGRTRIQVLIPAPAVT